MEYLICICFAILLNAIFCWKLPKFLSYLSMFTISVVLCQNFILFMDNSWKYASIYKFIDNIFHFISLPFYIILFFVNEKIWNKIILLLEVWKYLHHSFLVNVHTKKGNEWLLFNAISAIFQLYHGENKLIIDEMMMRSALF